MGNLALRVEDHLTALKCYDRAIAFSHGDSSAAHYGKALALENLGKVKEAVRILNTLIEQYPEDPLFLIEKAHCTLEMGYPLDALKLYRQATILWRRSEEFHEGLALYTGICSALLDLNMNREALEAAIEGLKRLHGGHPTLFYNAGRAFWGLGMTEDAKEILEEGLKRFPGDEDLIELLKEIEDDCDSPSSSGPPEFILATILLALIARRKHPKA
jgi:tetratricopeptide (TPR) repeat protein